MSWRVAWSRRSQRDLGNLERTVAARVVQAVRRFAAEQQGDVKPLQGFDGVWRFRVGDWRVILEVDKRAEQVTVSRVLPRGRAYRR